MLHDFFGKIYEEVYASIDVTAEEIRALGAKAPHTLLEFDKYRTVTDVASTEAQGMIADLVQDNQAVLSSLNKAFVLAETANEQGLLERRGW